MRFSSLMFAFACAALVSNGLFLSDALAQHYPDGVTVRKNPDGSIETFDSSEMPSRSTSKRSHTQSRKTSQRYNDGVVVRKNADGSIETFDAGDSVPSRGRQRSSGVHKAVHKYSDGVTVKRNPDGTIETSDSTPNVRSGSGSKSRVLKNKNASRTKSSAKHRVTNSKSRSRSNYGGVTVRKNADGSIETFDSN